MPEASRNPTPLIELRGVHKHYPDGDVRALCDIQLTITEGECIAVVGPSGCGKSTLLHMLGRWIDRPAVKYYFVASRWRYDLNGSVARRSVSCFSRSTCYPT